MATETILLEKRHGVAKITLNRPEALNALDGAMISALVAALSHVAADEEVRAVVLRGSGKSFCAGVDLKAMEHLLQDDGEDTLDLEGVGRGVPTLLESMPKPVIAAVHGYAITGGFALAYFCDLIVASEDAIFQDTHGRWGLVPAWWEALRLPRVVGIFRAKSLLFTSNRMTAAEAQQAGLVHRVVKRDELDQAVDELAAMLVSQSPAALAIIKAQINQGMRLDWENAVAVDAQIRSGLTGGFITEDARERLRTFVEKRA